MAEPPSKLLESLETAELVVARCLLARHHDGFVRQRQIDDLVRLCEPWSIPYVLALLGDYVLEIHQSRAETLVPALENDRVIRDLHGEFLSTNLEWWGLIQNRVVSYWATYHRFKYAMDGLKQGDGFRMRIRPLGWCGAWATSTASRGSSNPCASRDASDGRT